MSAEHISKKALGGVARGIDSMSTPKAVDQAPILSLLGTHADNTRELRPQGLYPVLAPIILTRTANPRVDSRLLAQHLGIQHKNVLANLRRHMEDFHQLGILAFKTPVINGRGQPEAFALLNEDQSCFLLSLFRYSKRVVDLKLQLVLVFRDVRQGQNIHRKEYLPGYRALHDEIARLAGDTPHVRFVHMNVNKVINHAIGLGSGRRRGLPSRDDALLVVALSLAHDAVAVARDHKDGYFAVKQAMHGLRQALEVKRNA